MNTQLSHKETKQKQLELPLILVSDGVQSPANIGAIFRACEAFGIEKMYLCNTDVNFDSPRLKKTARNTQKLVPFSVTTNALETVKDLKQMGYTIISIEITGTSEPLHSLKVNTFHKIAVVVGNEQDGVSADVLNFSDICTHIQMYGTNSSMNVAQATSIAFNTLIHKFNTIKT